MSSLVINRLRVLKGQLVAYDQKYRIGVNIIRGENSSGKSTIADFLFYALGGEFDRWKDAASVCTSVQVEISTAKATLTLHRNIGTKTEPVHVFYGSLEASLERGIGDWDRLPIRRPPGGRELSLTQIVFRAVGIPEAPSTGESNITLHQIMRLLYADQQTPAGKLFRFESFDTRDIRETVGQLIIGINGYELYDHQLRLRVLKAEYAEKDRLYKAAVLGLPSSEGVTSVQHLQSKLDELDAERKRVLDQIGRVDEYVNEEFSRSFVSERNAMRSKLREVASELSRGDSKEQVLHADIQEISDFYQYLQGQMEMLKSAQSMADALGGIEFQYCPSCLKPLRKADSSHCIVCHAVTDEEVIKSKYFEITIDVELQTRETAQLINSRTVELEQLRAELRALRRQYTTLQMEFSARYDISNSPRETYLAERNRRLGSIDREIVYLEELRRVIERVDILSRERNELNDKIESVTARLTKLENSASSRKTKSFNLISRIGTDILKNDLKREDAFEVAKSLVLYFGDDAISVDGKMNFAESSNVVLKNTSLLSLFLAACRDGEFWHPKLLIVDNVEDKGMEQERSYNYQRLIIRSVAQVKVPHQIIYTTSMLAPELEGSIYTVGPRYTRQNKTLKLG